jgi:hypothetical protein
VLLQVKDGFGLPLQASSNVWWTQDLDPAFSGPSVRQVRGVRSTLVLLGAVYSSESV